MFLRLQHLAAFAYNYNTTGLDRSHRALFAVVVGLIVVLAVLLVAAQWRLFQKAGRPGWAAIIPVYNIWVLFEIAGKPGWWAPVMIVLAFLPFVGAVIVLVVEIVAYVALGRRFGKGAVWSIFLLVIFGFIGFPILGFGKAQYRVNGFNGASAPPAA